MKFRHFGVSKEAVRIIREQTLGLAQSQQLNDRGRTHPSSIKLTHNTKEHKKHGVPCHLWGQLLASSQSFKNNSTAINRLQWKKYASFAKLLDGKIKQQIVVVVAEKFALDGYMILLKSSNSYLNTHCFQSRSDLTTASLCLRPWVNRLRQFLGLTNNWQKLQKTGTHSVFNEPYLLYMLYSNLSRMYCC